MGYLDSLGSLASSIVAVIVMLILAVLGYFITVFVVNIGAGLAGFSPEANFIALSAAVITAGAISAGATPLTAIAGVEE